MRLLLLGVAAGGLGVSLYTLGEAFTVYVTVRRRGVNGFYQIMSRGELIGECLRTVTQGLLALRALGLVLRHGVLPDNEAGVGRFLAFTAFVTLSSVNSLITRRKVLNLRLPK